MVSDQTISATPAATTGRSDASGRAARLDVIVLLLLGLLGALAAAYGFAQVPVEISTLRPNELWFDGDGPGVYDSMTGGGKDLHRPQVHPLFSLVSILPAQALLRLGLPPLVAVRTVMATVAFLWMCGLFVLFRRVGCRRPDAALLALLGGVSSAAMFRFVVPESYPFASLSIVSALIVTAAARERKPSETAFTLAGAATLSITITNWMIGILAALAHFPPRRAIQVCVNALVIVVALWTVEKFLFPGTKFFLDNTEEKQYMLMKQNRGPLAVLGSFFFHTVVLPAYYEFDLSYSLRHCLLTQGAAPGSATVWGVVGCALWLGLLGLGVWAAVGLKEHRRLVFVCGVALLGQLCLHLLYGNETFLYALNFLPLFLVLVSLGTLTRARPVVLGLLAALIVCAAINNVTQFRRAVDYFRQPAPTAQAPRAVAGADRPPLSTLDAQLATAPETR